MLMLLTIVLAANAWTLAQPRPGSEKKLAAQQLLQQTLAARASLTLAEYARNLERVTALDSKLAEAFHELGRAYIQQETIASRERAVAALERAIQLAPRQTEYRYTLAKLQLRRGAYTTAKSEFRRIMKIDPLDARPYYQLALFYEEDMLHYRDMISPHENATIYFYEFADKDFAEAERLLRSAIGLDPKMHEAYHHLAGLYFDAQRFDKMAELMEKAVTKLESVDLYLFLGLARQQQPGQADAAMQAYQQALQLMPPADRAFFYSLQTVLPPDSLKIYGNAAGSTQAQMQQRFWKSRDPLFLTAANERLLEHFGRIAYANLRYGFPEKNIAGWKTDRGQTLIRFGQPRSRTRTRADLGASATGRVSLKASKEFWNYGDFQMIFEDRFLNRNYAFAWGGVGEVDGRNLFEEKIRTVPERYDFPHGGRPLALPHVIAQFRADTSFKDNFQMAGDSTRLEIYYGIADSTLATRATVTLQRGLFIFDENWNEIRQWRGQRRFAAGDSIYRDRWPVQMQSGAYHVALEVLDPVSGRSGVAREKISVENFSGPPLSLSSVVLARADSSMPQLALYHENGVHLVPVLAPEFVVREPLYVYYEIYHLAFEASGRSRYRLDYTLAPEAADQSLVGRAAIRLGKIFGLNPQRAATGSSFETSGNRDIEKLYQGLEILGQTAGRYQLTIRVTDRVSGQTAERAASLAIKPKKENKD